MTGFNDGIVEIYSVQDIAVPGKKPREELALKCRLRYKRRTVGIKRHYAALNAGAKVDLLLRVHYRPEVSAQDAAVLPLEGKQYRITFVQIPEDVMPPVMDLTLERLERDYELPG